MPHSHWPYWHPFSVITVTVAVLIVTYMITVCIESNSAILACIHCISLPTCLLTGFYFWHHVMLLALDVITLMYPNMMMCCLCIYTFVSTLCYITFTYTIYAQGVVSANSYNWPCALTYTSYTFSNYCVGIITTNIFTLQGIINPRESCFRFLNWSSIFPKRTVYTETKRKRVYKK